MNLRDYLPGATARREAAALRATVAAKDAEMASFARETRDLIATANAAIKKWQQTSSGVEMVAGQFQYEFAKALRGDERWETLRKIETDPYVSDGLNAIQFALVQARWDVVTDDETPRGQEIRDFVAANLLRGVSEKFGRSFWCRTSWVGQRLPEILDMLPSGYSMFAKTMRREGSKWVYDQLQWLEPDSVDPRGWRLSDQGDNLVEVKRTYRNPNGLPVLQKSLGADRIQLYVWKLKGARFEGTPFTRPAYGAWFRKDWLLRQSMIFAQKVGAPPPYGSFPSEANWTAEMIEDFTEYVKSLRGTAPTEAFFVGKQDGQGHDVKVGYAGADVEQVDRMRGLIDGENRELSHGVNSKASMLGETTGGNRALGETLSIREMLTIQAVASVICEFETHGAGNLPGLIQELVDMNYANVEQYPTLRCSRISPFENLETYPQLVEGVKAGVIPKHPELSRQVTERLGYQLPDDAYELAPERTNPFDRSGDDGTDQAQGDAEDQGGDDAKADDSGDVAASLSVSAETMGRVRAELLISQDGAKPLTPKGRAPSRLEAAVCQLAAVNEAFRAGEREVGQALSDTRWLAIEEILGRVKAGKFNARNMESQARSGFKAKGKALGPVRRSLAAAGEKGREHAESEAKRGNAAAPKLATSKLKAIVQAYEDEISLVAELNVEEVWSSLLHEALAEWGRLNRQGLTDDELFRQLQTYLENLSTKDIEQAARQASTVAYNQGRDVSLREAKQAGLAQLAVRSELLDDRTCSSCAALDNTVVEIGSPEYEALMPPARCEGGDNCRGFYIPIGEGML